MDQLLSNPTYVASIAAVLVAFSNVLKRWLELRDRQSQRAAVLAMHGNARALELLAQSAPPTTGEINSGPVVLLAIGFASALYVNMPDVWVAAPALNRECSSAADCFDGERCERGKCVSSARKPRPPVRRNNQPSSSSGEDATGLALWWAPPYLRRDPYASIWDRY